MLTCSGIVLQRQLVVNAMDTQLDIEVDAYFLFYFDSCTTAMASKNQPCGQKNLLDYEMYFSWLGKKATRAKSTSPHGETICHPKRDDLMAASTHMLISY